MVTPNPNPTTPDHPLAIPFTPERLDVARVIVPVDESSTAVAALTLAEWIAAANGALLRVLHVVHDATERDEATAFVRRLAKTHGASGWEVTESDSPAQAIAEAIGNDPQALGCLPTHGRDRSAALLGSVAWSVLAHTDRPLLLTGPRAEGRHPLPHAPVAVAVDGTSADEALLPTALAWAAMLERRLIVATVAEPAPRMHEEDPVRAHGPADPERHVNSLIERCQGAGVSVEPLVIYNPLSVRDGMASLHAERQPALTIVGSRRPKRFERVVLGDNAARIVHDAPCGALAVATASQ